MYGMAGASHHKNNKGIKAICLLIPVFTSGMTSQIKKHFTLTRTLTPSQASRIRFTQLHVIFFLILSKTAPTKEKKKMCFLQKLLLNIKCSIWCFSKPISRNKNVNIKSSAPSLWMVLSPKRCMTSGDISGCYNWGGGYHC